MILNILKDINWIDELAPHVAKLIDVHYTYPNVRTEHDAYFDPGFYRLIPPSRTYPKLDPVINFRPEYKLPFNISHYLPLFVIRELYKDRKDILIEDVGAGSGSFIYFLAKSGFTNFHTIDAWCECPRQLFDDMMVAAGATCQVNNFAANPVIIHNCSAPRFCFISPGIGPVSEVFKSNPEWDYATYATLKRNLSNTELICFYCNNVWEDEADARLSPLGYVFLCKDSDRMANVWCRKDKFEEFRDKLKRWEA